MQSLYSLTEAELRDWLVSKKEKPFTAGQIFQWLYEKKVGSWDEMTNLSKALREKLSSNFKLHTLKLRRILDSEDCQTTKFLWELSDGNLVESVLIRAPERRTVCVSSQVGCPARCAFCASGKNGLLRNLDTAEIIEQIIQTDRYLKDIPKLSQNLALDVDAGEVKRQILRQFRYEGEKVCHIVFMGMGEPFENYDNVLKTIRLINDPKCLNISQRKITVSTVGLVDKIIRFADEGLSVNLVLSLHAPNQNLRKKIIPYARKYDLPDLLEAMLYFAKTTRRDITYEYTLMEGLNDAEEHALELVQLVKRHPCTVNLIPYNPIEGITLKRPGKESIEQFREILVSGGIPTTWRYTKGKDIAAACGQLALQKNEKLALV